MNAPVPVDIDPELVLPDRIAAMFVDQMLANIVHANTVLDNRVGFRSGSVGNPTGQRRFFNALLRNYGDALLGSFLETGTRKRFIMVLDVWTRGYEETAGWLIGARLQMEGKGPNREADKVCLPMVGFSRHALIRLVQRAKCRRPEDLVTMLRRVWGLSSLLYGLKREDLPGPGHPGWLIPVNGMDGECVYPVVKGGDGRRGEPILAITTILTRRMLTGDVRAAFTPWDEFFTRHARNLNAASADPGLIDVLEATSKASRRGRAAQ